MENQQVSLSHLFGSVVNSMQENQTYLNSLDGRDGDAGDNSLNNFRVVTQAVQAAEQQGLDVEGQLQLAAQSLRQQGQGQLAQLYASGFENSASQYRGRSGLTMGDFGSLIEGLSGGMSQAGARPQGQGSPLDALLPALMGYMVAKQRGASDRDAILGALMGAAGQSGMLGGAQQGMTPGGGMGNLLSTLLGGLLGGGMAQSGGMPQGRRMPPQSQGGDPLSDLLGGLLGGGMAQSGGMPQGRRMPPQSQGGDPLSDLLGGLLGGGTAPGGRRRPMQPDEGTVLGGPPMSPDEGTVLANLSQGMPGGEGNIASGGSAQAMPDAGAAASATFIEGILRGFLGGGESAPASDVGVGAAAPGRRRRSHRKRL